MAFNAFRLERPVDPESVEPSFLDHNDWKALARPGPRLLLDLCEALQQPGASPPRSECFDILSPPPGDSDVISQIDRLSSNETKIAPRSVRIAVGVWGWSATICMVASRVRFSNLTLPERRSLSTYPWDLEGR